MLDYAGVLNRLVVVEEEGLLAASTPPTTVEARPYFWYTGERFPYFTNRIATGTMDQNSEDVDVITQDIIARLVIGHLTSGYKGERDAELNIWLPHMLEYFSEREWLQSSTYPAKLANFTRVRLVSWTGYTVFANSGTELPAQVGTEFTLRCEFDHEILQVYA